MLATDGEPNCGAGSGRSGTGSSDDAAAIAAVGDALATGFKTFVIGVATGSEAEDVLEKMARAGGEPRPSGPAYYRVVDRDDLVNALGAITGLVTDRVFRLDQPPPSPMDVAVSVGRPASLAIPLTPTDGTTAPPTARSSSMGRPARR